MFLLSFIRLEIITDTGHEVKTHIVIDLLAKNINHATFKILSAYPVTLKWQKMAYLQTKSLTY